MSNPQDINPYDLSQRDKHKYRKYESLINASRKYNALLNKPLEERSPYDLSYLGAIKRAKSKLEREVRKLRRL